MITIKMKVKKGLEKPSMIDRGDWIDLRAAEDVELKAPKYNVHTNELEFQTGMIDLGIAAQLPEEYEALVVARSSTFKNYGIMVTNSIGIIDGSYNGDNDYWKLPYIAFKDAKIRKGDRIAQFRIQKSQFNTEETGGDYRILFVDTLGNEDRGGFGSTGKS